MVSAHVYSIGTALQLFLGEMLLLFASGITLAKGFVVSGLSHLLGKWLALFANLPAIIMIVTLCLAVTYLIKITSNTKTVTLLMATLVAATITLGYGLKMLMVTAAICASCAFMLRVATVPNAIVYVISEIEIKDIVKKGAVLSFIIFCLVSITYYLLLLVITLIAIGIKCKYSRYYFRL